MFRPQRFARSRRLPPLHTLPACFIRLPRPRFALQGFFPLASPPSSSLAGPLLPFRALACEKVAPRAPAPTDRLQGLDPTTDSLSFASRLRLTATRSPPEIHAPAGFSPRTLEPFITAPPLMTLSPASRSDSGGGSSACRSMRDLLLCPQTISLFELSGHPLAACAPTGEAPTSRTISRPPDAATSVQRPCHPQA
jgi:hypothetical protein